MNLKSSFFWLVLPVCALIAQAFIEVSFTPEVLAGIHSEFGPHELLQFFIIALAIVPAVMILRMPQLKKMPFLYGWAGIALLACIYVAGEEMTWGQHIMKWSTPEYWAAINDQGETNLHNTSSWLDQKPRLVLEIGVIVGGLIIPLLMRFQPRLLPARFAVIYPDYRLSLIAGVVLASKIIDKFIEKELGFTILHRGSEVEELFLFYFVLLYLVYLREKIKISL